mmetsp:Transcript_23998/g.66739  ORF Transcript_23998/g.66739 Transcript_23998/m.66739 type:complete len:89 (-) Transcript_23998:33-299(-)
MATTCRRIQTPEPKKLGTPTTCRRATRIALGNLSSKTESAARAARLYITSSAIGPSHLVQTLIGRCKVAAQFLCQVAQTRQGEARYKG